LPNVVQRVGTTQVNIQSPEQADGPLLISLADVQPAQVSWLWLGRIPRGKLTLLVGDPGLGKSFVTLDMAARVSTGSAWPDGKPVTQGPVVILSAEDDLADTIVPRLDAHGADRRFVFCLKAVRQSGREKFFSLKDDLKYLASTIDYLKPNLVIIDPLSAYMGMTNTSRDADVRFVLGPLTDLAAQTGVAILAVMHLNKASKNHVIYRTSGSVAFTASARSLLALTRDPGDESRRVLCSIKNNLSPPYAVTGIHNIGEKSGCLGTRTNSQF